MTAADIIEALGGTTSVASYTGWPTSTVDSWITNRHIPEWRRAALMRMALDRGVALSTDDFPAKPAKAA